MVLQVAPQVNVQGWRGSPGKCVRFEKGREEEGRRIREDGKVEDGEREGRRMRRLTPQEDRRREEQLRPPAGDCN